MKNIIKILVMLSIILLGMESCRNGKAAQEAMQIVKKYSGKMFKSAEKEGFYLRYGDDVIRNIEFIKIECIACDGSGTDSWGDICEKCDGDGYVYEIQTK